MLHGFLGGPASFAEVIATMPSEIPTFSPALCGHAGTSNTSVCSSFEAEADRLACLVRGLHPSAPCHLVGYSLGGQLAISLLIRYPGLFRSATLISTRRGLDSKEELEWRRMTDEQWSIRLRTETLSNFLDAWESQPMFATQHQLPAENCAA